MAQAKITILDRTVGQLQTNCYIVFDTDTRDAVIIDPGDDAEFLSTTLTENGLTPKAILATHGHFDHVLGAGILQDVFQIPFYIHEKDLALIERMKGSAEYFLHRPVEEYTPGKIMRLPEKNIVLGSLRLAIVFTPGHTPGSVSFFIKSINSLFVGDLLFAGGSVGRTDFTYSDKALLDRSIALVLSYAIETVIYPGHGDKTTIGQEKSFHTGVHI